MNHPAQDGRALMGLFNDLASALKNVVLMQSNLERLEQTVERLDGDIAGLREAIGRVSERLVRVETIIDVARGCGPGPTSVAVGSIDATLRGAHELHRSCRSQGALETAARDQGISPSELIRRAANDDRLPKS